VSVRRTPRLARALASLLAGALAAPALPAQGVRISGITTAQFLGFRRTADDSVLASTVAPIEGTTLAEAPDGSIVRCTPGLAWCRYRRPSDVASTVPLLQDLQVAAWGFGTGVSAHAHLRAREAFGPVRDLYPRARDRFDLLSAYVELDRATVRARLGRQWVPAAGFGLANYDGASVQWRPRREAALELYGGWSLAPGLNEPRTSGEIADVELLAPDDRGYVVGGMLHARPLRPLAVSARWQRDIRTDRLELFAERVATDATWRLGRGGVDATWVHDLGTGTTNEARLRARLPEWRGASLAVEARRFRPFFELWTIWGAFSPVGYGETRGTLAWRGSGERLGRVGIDLVAGRRTYDATEAGVASAQLRDDGWRAGGDASVRLARDWSATAGYRREIGFGASRADQQAGVRWDPSGPVSLGAHVTAFQTLLETRFAFFDVKGAGVDAAWRLGPDMRVVGDLAAYRNSSDERSPSFDWTQWRGALRFEWTVGPDPGTAATGSAR
jgi:hypothetical protein